MDVFAVALEAINNNAKQLETVSQNVANINTPGYLKSVPFAQYVQGKDGEQATLKTAQLVATAGGTLDQTGRDLDVAVVNQGFFQLEMNGQSYISRSGHFYVDNEHYLRHPSGAYVLGEGGRVTIDGQNIVINSDRTITVDGVEVDRLNIVEPGNKLNISATGAGLYQAPVNELIAIDAQVTQKALNSANVNPSEEMVRMIEVSRHLQTTQKMVNAYDQLLNVGINELGKK